MRIAAALLTLATLAWAGTLEGRVENPDGTPRPGMTVEARSMGNEKVTRVSTLTDKDGAYRFAGLPPGRYVVMLRDKPAAKDDLMAQLGDVFLKALLRNVDPRNVVTVQKEGAVRKDLRLPRLVKVTATLTRGGEPVPAWSLRLYPIGQRSGPIWMREERERRPRTDRAGAADFGSVPEGEYLAAGERGRITVQFAELPLRADIPVEMELELGVFEVKVRVVDSKGEPVPRVDLQAHRLGLPKYIVDLDGASDKDGTYTIPHVDQGKYGVGVWAQNAHASQQVEVGPTNPAPEIVLRLPPTGVLVVTVRDATGAPRAGVKLRVRAAAGVPVVGGHSGRDGKARFELPAGTWHVAAAKAEKSVPIVLKPGQTVELELTKP